MHKPPQLNMRNAPTLDMEFRRYPAITCNLRLAPPATDGSPSYKIEGYAVKWADVNSHAEMYQRGCFAASIAAFDAKTTPIHMYYNHGWANPWEKITNRVGKWLVIREDDVGLWVEGELTPNLSSTADLSAMINHGTVDGISICFGPLSSDDYTYNGAVLVILNAKLYEISIVDEPSARNARITGAEMQRMLKQARNDADIQGVLVAAGINKAEAAEVISALRSLNSDMPSAQPAQKINNDMAGLLAALAT